MPLRGNNHGDRGGGWGMGKEAGFSSHFVPNIFCMKSFSALSVKDYA